MFVTVKIYTDAIHFVFSCLFLKMKKKWIIVVACEERETIFKKSRKIDILIKYGIK